MTLHAIVLGCGIFDRGDSISPGDGPGVRLSIDGRVCILAVSREELRTLPFGIDDEVEIVLRRPDADAKGPDSPRRLAEARRLEEPLPSPLAEDADDSLCARVRRRLPLLLDAAGVEVGPSELVDQLYGLAADVRTSRACGPLPDIAAQAHNTLSEHALTQLDKLRAQLWDDGRAEEAAWLSHGLAVLTRLLRESPSPGGGA